MSRNLADIVALASSGVPVLCVDTCCVLDIIRDPTRDAVQAHERQAALTLVEAIEAGRLIGVLAQQVELEFAANRPGVQQETSEALDAMRKRLRRMDRLAAAFGAEGETGFSHFDDYLARSEAVVDRWIAATDRVAQSPMISHLGFQRMMEGRTPAQKGKDSTKDCIVIETYLDAIRQARSGGATSPIGFASSNTKDYGSEVRSILRADLAEEFAALGVEYFPNLSMARHRLGL